MATVSSATPGYVWEDPGDAIMIQVSLDLVARLGSAVEQGLGAGPRGTEIGGLLLGRKLPGFARAVLVDDFEVVPCQHLRGASYTLLPHERQQLTVRLARHEPGQVAGFFRSHTRPGLYLDQDDFAILSQYFPDPWQVFLLVRPSPEGSAAGGFFFWEEGGINRRAPYRQFPFDAQRLVAGGFPIVHESPAVTAEPPAPRLVPKPVTQPAARAPRKLPQVSRLVVPVIAAAFLIAALVFSESRPAKLKPAPAKTIPPLETLLPQPLPPSPVSGVPVEPQAAPVASGSAVRPARKRKMQLLAPPPATLARVPFRAVPPPPALHLPAGQPALPVAKLLELPEPPPPPVAEVSYSLARGGVLRRALHTIASIGGQNGFIPPSPTQQFAPANLPGMAARTVNVKVYIDESGKVTRAQLLSKPDDLAAQALHAALRWQFSPARKHGAPAPSAVVLHFRFGGAP